MSMFNIEIEPFINFLMELELPAKQSRMRTRFCKLGIERLSLLEEEKMEIIKKHANIDENGEVKQVKDEQGRLIWDIKVKDGFNADYKELMIEEWVLELNEEKKDMLLTLKDVVLNLDIILKGKEALQYDRWCEIVEQIKY